MDLSCDFLGHWIASVLPIHVSRNVLFGNDTGNAMQTKPILLKYRMFASVTLFVFQPTFQYSMTDYYDKDGVHVFLHVMDLPVYLWDLIVFKRSIIFAPSYVLIWNWEYSSSSLMKKIDFKHFFVLELITFLLPLVLNSFPFSQSLR